MKTATRINAIRPASFMASRDDMPSVGLIVLELVTDSLNGSAPALILLASAEASAAVKPVEPPSIWHFPPVICCSTTGQEIAVSSIQIEMVFPTNLAVASENFSAPAWLSFSDTT